MKQEASRNAAECGVGHATMKCIAIAKGQCFALDQSNCAMTFFHALKHPWLGSCMYPSTSLKVGSVGILVTFHIGLDFQVFNGRR